MNTRIPLLMLMGSAACLLILTCHACSADQNKRWARTALDASQISCVLLANMTDEESIARACEIASDLRPHLRELLKGKASAARAGACVGGAEHFQQEREQTRDGGRYDGP